MYWKKWSNFDLNIVKELEEKPLLVKKQHANAIDSYNNQRKNILNKIKEELIKSINKFFEQIGEVTEEIYEKNKINEDFFIFTKSKNSQLYELNSKFFLFNCNYDKSIPIISSSMLTTLQPLCNKKSNLKKILILKNELTLTKEEAKREQIKFIKLMLINIVCFSHAIPCSTKNINLNDMIYNITFFNGNALDENTIFLYKLLHTQNINKSLSDVFIKSIFNKDL